MADTTTTNYSLTKPEVGASEDTWGTKLNTNLDTIDGKLDDIEGKSGAGTLKYADSAKLATTSTGIDVTGTVTADGLTVENPTAGQDTEVSLRFPAGEESYIQWTEAGVASRFAIGVDDGDDFNIKQGNWDGTHKDFFKVADNGDISFYEDTGTTAKFFWDASAERLGIGTSNPIATLSIEDNSYIAIDASDATYPYIGSVGSSADTCVFGSWGDVIINADYNNTSANNIIFKDGTIERMRIDSSGNLLVGKTSSQAAGNGFEVYNGGAYTLIDVGHPSGTSGNTSFCRFIYDSSLIGSITQSGTTGVAYNTSSDYRLKTDVQPMTGATERLKALKPVNFEWIADGTRVDGFLAHEAQEVVPEAVTGTKDAMRTEEYEVTPAVLDDDGNVVTEAVMGEREVPDYQGIDQSKLVPLLVATVQEQQAVIESLTARIEALEA